MSAIGLKGLIFSKEQLSSNTFKRSAHFHLSSSSTLRRMCKMESLLCLGEVLRGGGFKSGEGLFSLRRSKCYNFLTLLPSLFLFLSPPVELSFLYLSPFHQNLLIHMPLFHFLHSLMHSLQNFLFDKHSLKAIHSLTIKYFQVGYLSPSLDLNVL